MCGLKMPATTLELTYLHSFVWNMITHIQDLILWLSVRSIIHRLLLNKMPIHDQLVVVAPPNVPVYDWKGTTIRGSHRLKYPSLFHFQQRNSLTFHQVKEKCPIIFVPAVHVSFSLSKDKKKFTVTFYKSMQALLLCFSFWVSYTYTHIANGILRHYLWYWTPP